MITHQPSQKMLAEKVEWMDSSMKRAHGLLKYKTAPESFAAIFKLPLRGIFPLVHTFGMKFPIDIFFCDRNKKVIAKFTSVSAGRLVFPWKYIFGGCAYLIEFSKCAMADVHEGDQLGWSDDAA